MDQHLGSCRGADGSDIVFAAVGQGPPLILSAWWTSHLELDWQNRELRSFVEALAQNRTVVRYDRPGVGLSRPAERAYDLASEVGYLEAVIDAVGDGTVDLLGISCGGPPSVALAQLRPELVTNLVLFGSYAQGSRIADAATLEALRELVKANWGLGSQILTNIFLPDGDSTTARRFSAAQRHTTTAEVAGDLLQLTFDMDVATTAPELTQPTLVLHRERDRVVDAELGRELAELIPGSTFRLLEGTAHHPWAERPEEVTQLIEEFLSHGAAPRPVTRRLASVVFVDIVDSTGAMDTLGDSRWRRHLDALHVKIDEEARAGGGRVVKDTGDGAMVEFPLPGDALLFATSVRDRAGRLGSTLRAGVHTGEVELRGDDLTGRTVVIAARLCDLAAAEQILASSTTLEMAAGRSIALTPLGLRELRGIPDAVSVVEIEPRPRPDEVADPNTPRFERRGDHWIVSFAGEEATVRHSKGMVDLATLCRSPGTEIDVVALMDGAGAGPRSTGTEVLDRSAITAYRARLGEIEAELDAADAAGDADRSACLDDERGVILAELRAAAGLGSRVRRMGDDVERARKAVSGRIRDAIRRIDTVHPALATELSEHVSTGRMCRYR